MAIGALVYGFSCGVHCAFVCLSVNNLLLFLDLVVFPDIDFRVYRLIAALVGVLFLLYGFIWEAE